jgi:4-amino-4-deoxy-L-arabinose transferase-like glycosyltransferase
MTLSAPIYRVLRSPLAMLLVAFAVRVAVLTFTDTFPIPSEQDNFRFGFETGRIARSVASGDGFSSPFVNPTGATAWLPPVYPYLLAGIFKVFGIYTTASALCALILNSLFSALTCITIFSIGRKTVGVDAAIWAAWIWAFFPYAVWWSIRWIWATSLSALLSTVVILLTLQVERRSSIGGWSVLGLLWGFVAITETALLAMLPFFLVWLIWRLARQRLAFGPGVAAFTIAFVTVLSPWLVRNYLTFSDWVFVRSNFGMELRGTNYEGSTGLREPALHPADNDAEREKLRQVGELAYVDAKKREAIDFIAQRPGTFLWLTLKRIFYFWIGTPSVLSIFFLSGRFVAARYVLFTSVSVLAFLGLLLSLRNRVPGATLLAIAIAVYPLVFYITSAHPRYRHPIEPVMVLLTGYLMTAIFSQSSDARRALHQQILFILTKRPNYWIRNDPRARPNLYKYGAQTNVAGSKNNKFSDEIWGNSTPQDTLGRAFPGGAEKALPFQITADNKENIMCELVQISSADGRSTSLYIGIANSYAFRKRQRITRHIWVVFVRKLSGTCVACLSRLVNAGQTF